MLATDTAKIVTTYEISSVEMWYPYTSTGVVTFTVDKIEGLLSVRRRKVRRDTRCLRE